MMSYTTHTNSETQPKTAMTAICLKSRLQSSSSETTNEIEMHNVIPKTRLMSVFTSDIKHGLLSHTQVQIVAAQRHAIDDAIAGDPTSSVPETATTRQQKICTAS